LANPRSASTTLTTYSVAPSGIQLPCNQHLGRLGSSSRMSSPRWVHAHRLEA
jgi:hypothetical protein